MLDLLIRTAENRWLRATARRKDRDGRSVTQLDHDAPAGTRRAPDRTGVNVQVPIPKFGNSPDSGRPPVERPPRQITAPGGRPDTTTLPGPGRAWNSTVPV
ncbi:MAG: hypothetical protein ACRDSO_15145 [Pseudonocardiaceae bacterium]